LIGGMYLSFAPRFRHRQGKEDLAEAEGSAGKTTDQS